MYLKLLFILLGFYFISGSVKGQVNLITQGFVVGGGSTSESLSFDYSLGQPITFTHQTGIKGNSGILQVIDLISTFTNDLPEFPINIYPNPVSTFIELNHDLESIIYIKIYNSSGQILNQFSLNPTDKTINVEGYPSGHYFINISGEKFAPKVYKFIKI